MKITNSITDRVLTKAYGVEKNGKVEVFVDPASLTLIASIISSLITLFSGCGSYKNATDVAQDPTPQQVRILRREVRRKLGWWRNWREGDKVVKAILDTGKEVKQTEMKALYVEHE